MLSAARARDQSALSRTGTAIDISSITLSVVIPAYNEIKTLEEIVSRVEAVPVRTEIIVTWRVPDLQPHTLVR